MKSLFTIAGDNAKNVSTQEKNILVSKIGEKEVINTSIIPKMIKLQVKNI